MPVLADDFLGSHGSESRALSSPHVQNSGLRMSRVCPPSRLIEHLCLRLVKLWHQMASRAQSFPNLFLHLGSVEPDP